MSSPESPVRVRFAPSPTGFFHIGGARTALFNWLYARKTGGTFVLRIEDTDAARNTPEALAALLGGLRWLGLGWDEGPEVGGGVGPYFQSERGEIYREYLEKLRAKDRVYEKDGALWLRLEGERYTTFDEYRKAEVEKVKTTPQVIDDLVRGRVEKAVEEDFVLFRADGSPGFHFTNVVDDLTMGITHVIRGEDHLSNTPRHQEIYAALGATPPKWAHIPLILKSDGKGKMSKRETGALLEEYIGKHYVPAGVLNALALLGWNPKDNRDEVMSVDEMIAAFDLKNVQKGGARFDEKKMAHFNTEHLRRLPPETFAWQAKPILAEAGVVPEGVDEDFFLRVMTLCQPKARGYDDLPGMCAFFFTDDFEVDEKSREKVMKKGEPAERLAELRIALEAVDEGVWTEETLTENIHALSEETGHGLGAYMQPARLALSGTLQGPEFAPMLVTLGRERTLRRLQALPA